MAATTTVIVPHLGGITAGYKLSAHKYDTTKPTCVLINSMCTTVSLFADQFSDVKLTDALNLLAIEPLGHGATTCPIEQFTYWDSATVALQVMDALGIEKAFAMGSSQGGWIIVRMALIAPERILGLMPLGTSMDCESADSRSKNAWDPSPMLTPFYDKWCSFIPDFVVDDVWCGMVVNLGFSGLLPREKVDFWYSTMKSVYKGDDGRKKLKVALACLLERDGILLRLREIQCPVYWLQGDKDIPYGIALAAEQIELFKASRKAKLDIVKGGSHFLNATHPTEVSEALLKLVNSDEHTV
ncbi:hypothetical protein GYMLUDRAFT_48507 [Collybiopsis luxurians FD-317 M1]|uniref:AB hydrolase-1 domain-containing protein n=1 Tax=Collybiopsis luxurians FD-317 M1 TaxID=944289 RepID=A0A0D0AVR3_9AGAR|nr:hypothetical protein GYMLUDRAFT_48507 [Collybiopsis luxurians FD-317 M1]